ncbi:MAG: hypothetical protein AAGI49_07745 [Bacteroidota bacterium]
MNNSFYNFTLFSIGESKNSVQTTDFRPLLVLVMKASLNEANHTLLNKILSAIQLAPEKDVFLLAVEAEERIDFHAYACRAVLSFDVPLRQAGIHYPMQAYHLLDYNERQFLQVDDLAKIAAERDLKAKLWEALKLMKGRWEA